MHPNSNRRIRRNINYIFHINFNEHVLEDLDIDIQYILPLIFFVRRRRSKKYKDRLRKKLERNSVVLKSKGECAICLSKFSQDEKGRKFKCKHIFHKDCVDEWILRNEESCPICRKFVF